ncbi:MAG TPA: ATP-binding protein [Thermomicrobiales bacterium]|nr:ATP-binding protein [Thermomicrobiales bacterium]
MTGWLNRRGIRVRLTLWYLLVLAVVLALFGGGVYFALRESLEDGLETSVRSRSDALLSVVQMENGNPALPASMVESSSRPDTEDEDLDDDPDDEQFARTWDRAGNVISDAGGDEAEVPARRSVVLPVVGGTERWATLPGDDANFHVFVRPIVDNGEVVGVLEVGQSHEEIDETLGALLIILMVATPITLVLAGIGGLLIAGRALEPVDSVTRLARRISAEDLSGRLDLDLPDDELGRLARTFDEMIARLESAFRRQRQFTGDASHELRTPLTALKGQVEVALARPREPDEYRAVLHVVNEEVDRLIHLVGSLLTLARADAGEISLAREPISLGDAVVGAVEQLEPFAEQRGIGLRVEPGPETTIEADESLLLQLLLNLLDNAIKYTPVGGAVQVSWVVEAESAFVTVTDNGVGIEPQHLPHVFERFYRVDKARSRGDGGTGLGLAISRWIAEAHGGEITAVSTPGHGTSVTIRLPLS